MQWLEHSDVSRSSPIKFQQLGNCNGIVAFLSVSIQHNVFIAMLIVSMLNVILVSGIMLSVIMLSEIMPIDTVLSVIMLSVILLSVFSYCMSA